MKVNGPMLSSSPYFSEAFRLAHARVPALRCLPSIPPRVATEFDPVDSMEAIELFRFIPSPVSHLVAEGIHESLIRCLRLDISFSALGSNCSACSWIFRFSCRSSGPSQRG